jgi:hypothetical protein
MAEAIDPKYIFDLENPRSSPTYKLLKKIIKDGNHLAFMDPYFFSEIYYKEIFDITLEDELWDKPLSYEDMSGIEKALTFIKNLSFLDYQRLLETKIPLFNRNIFHKIFGHLLLNSNTSNPINLDSIAITSNWQSQQIESLFRLDTLIPPIKVSLPRIEKNFIFFVTAQNNNYWQCLYAIAQSSRITSALIVNQSDYNYYESLLNMFPHVKPIILHRPQDIHVLFEALMLDIYRQKGTENSTFSQEIHYAESFTIKNYFSIENAHLENLGKYREIYFLGENGDGKTILLQSMVLALKGRQQDGFVMELLKENPYGEPLCKASDSAGTQYGYDDETAGKPHPIVLGYGSGRFRNDAGLANETGYESLFNHKHEVYLHSPEQWLKDLRLNELSKNGTHPAISSEKAIHLLQKLLHDNVVIEIIGSEVDFIERGTRLKFKQLSDGYKSVLVWLCDMLARLTKAQPEVEELEGLQGIVLVDEIGLYLHPKWQYQLVRQLRDWFPKVQFIFTTHSPMIILGASRDAVFFRVYKEDGVTQVSEHVEMSSIANQMANSLITAPFLFNMETARPAAFDPTTEHLETADDYISGQIDQEIARRVQEQHHSSPEDIAAMIAQELDAFERKQKEGVLE